MGLNLNEDSFLVVQVNEIKGYGGSARVCRSRATHNTTKNYVRCPEVSGC